MGISLFLFKRPVLRTLDPKVAEIGTDKQPPFLKDVSSEVVAVFNEVFNDPDIISEHRRMEEVELFKFNDDVGEI